MEVLGLLILLFFLIPTVSIYLTISNQQQQHEDADRGPKIESRAKRTGDAMTWMDRRRRRRRSSSVLVII